MPELTLKGRGRREPAQAYNPFRHDLAGFVCTKRLGDRARWVDPVMKGHEDGGNVLYERCEALLPGKLEALSDRSLERR